MKILFLILLAMNFHSIIAAQNLHAFLFCKTSDRKIGFSVRINYINMREQSQQIASALGLKYIEHPLTGSNFNVQNVNTLLSQTQITSDDIVILYFSTHGAKSRWDTNIFPQIDIPDSLIAAYKKHLGLLEKKPKMILTAIEACSGYQKITPQEAFVYEQRLSDDIPDTLSSLQVANIKKLFSSSCGIIVTAGQPGKNTWATANGSMFTNCFLRALTEQINMPLAQSSKVGWENLLKQAKEYTYNMTKTTSIRYYPVWEKKDCNGLVNQSYIDSSKAETYAVLNLKCSKSTSGKNPYLVNLSVRNLSPERKITKVVYFLHNTFRYPEVMVKNTEANFQYSFTVWGEFLIKAKVFFEDGLIVDAYENIDLSSCRK
jgi:hypothetical protein